jgi:hypothetical protein
MSGIEILWQAEALRKEAMYRTVALLPLVNGAVECLSQAIHSELPLAGSAACRELLETASIVYREFRLERSVAYDPFDIFWDNPDEPRHSRLLRYFIHPRAEHRCGPYLFGSFLRALDIVDPDFPVDDGWEVECEDEHIDLLITRDRDDGRYAIIIENKVNGAVDQKRQLQTYYEVLTGRHFKDKEIYVCYLPLRDGRPSPDSVGNIGNRLKVRTFKDHIVPWLKAVLRDKDNWPVGMAGDLRDNLKHYLDLIKWRLNEEKIMQMNERIFVTVQDSGTSGRA